MGNDAGKEEEQKGIRLGAFSASLLFVISVLLFTDILDFILAKKVLSGLHAVISSLLVILVFGAAVGFISYKTTLSFVVDKLAKLKAGEFAKTPLIGKPNMSKKEAQSRLSDSIDDFMFVMEGGTTQGIVTSMDLTKKTGKTLKELKTGQMVSVDEDTDLRTVLKVMQATGRTRLAVRDKTGMPTRYINLKDIMALV